MTIPEACGAMLVGAVVGLAELLSRYRDAKVVWRSLAAYVYMTINAGASLIALYFFDMKYPSVDAPSAAFASGIGAMAIFRTSLFVVRVGGQDVAVGPGGFLQLLLGAADRAVDRLQGAHRSRAAAQIMAGVSFLRAHEALPISCLNLVQGIPDSEQQSLGQEIRDLHANVDMPDNSKAYNLGLLLINAVGEDVLKAAVAALGDAIGYSRRGDPQAEPRLVEAPVLAIR